MSRRKKSGRKRGTYVSLKMRTQMTYRSGWELAYFQYLDSSPDVIEFYSEPFKIAYVTNKRTGRTRNYIPDVLVVFADKRILVEIKPKNKLTKRVNQKKFAAAQEWCSVNNATFQVITELELKGLGLI